MAVVPAIAHAADAATGVLSSGARYLHWGVVQISLTNFLIILGMVVLFVLALVLPFPHGKDDRAEVERSDDPK